MEQLSTPTATRVWLVLYPPVVIVAATFIAEQSPNLVLTAVVVLLAVVALMLAWRTARPHLRNPRMTFDRAVCLSIALALAVHITYPYTQHALHITNIAALH